MTDPRITCHDCNKPVEAGISVCYPCKVARANEGPATPLTPLEGECHPLNNPDNDPDGWGLCL